MGRNIMLVLAYDGEEFHGWQAQPDLRTVQGTVEAAVRYVVCHRVNLQGSGRTDAGVHAVGQVACFTTHCDIPVQKLRPAIGSRLPKDVSIISVREVASSFDPTRSSTSKLYRYRIHNAPQRPVNRLTHRQTYHFWHPLDEVRMRQGAKWFVGTHDFSAMASKGAPRETTIRTVYRCDVERDYDEIRVDVEGRGFLYNQVRNMVGTLIEVGRGRWEPDEVKSIIESLDRGRGGPTVPAKGLSLQWVRYPPELLHPDEADPAAPAEPSEPVHPSAGQ